jgi:LAGLIDADG DNA endonuclease family
LYDLFEPLTNIVPKIKIIKPDSRTGKQYKSIRFTTLAMSCLNYYYNLFYNKDDSKFIKLIPSNISYLLSARSLAFLIMEDGSRGSFNEILLDIRAFKEYEVNLLRKALELYFNLRTRLLEKLPNQWIIVIPIKKNKINRDSKSLYAFFYVI